jgi:folate-dependent phosphoribosylglycinamide formyltransferase PurN
LADLTAEAPLNHRLILARPGRQFSAIEDSRWGELILPAPEETAVAGGGLRLVLFASFEFGYLALLAAKAYAARHPGKVTLVALVTDDPVNPEARIGLKKRVWKLLGDGERVAQETAIADEALAAGAPVYTGEVKTEAFRRHLARWQPDAILSCVFGQVIDEAIIGLPPLGIYNFHPSDLGHGHGAGPAPYEDLAARGATRTCWTIHQLTPAVDGGPILGQSPPIEVGTADGRLPDQPLLVYDKLMAPVGWLTLRLVNALAERRARGEMGAIERLDLADAMPAALRAALLLPVTAERHEEALPVLDAVTLGTLPAPGG